MKAPRGKLKRFVLEVKVPEDVANKIIDRLFDGAVVLVGVYLVLEAILRFFE